MSPENKDQFFADNELKPLTTDTQLTAFRYIFDFRQDHSYGPTIRDICKGLGIDSTSHIKSTIVTLKQSGYITYDLGYEGRMVSGSIDYLVPLEDVKLMPGFRHKLKQT